MTDNEIINTLERIRAFFGDESELISRQKAEIEKLAASDVVSVVRCRDCIHCEAGGYTDLLYCEYFDWGITADDFCSYGERRDEE